VFPSDNKQNTIPNIEMGKIYTLFNYCQKTVKMAMTGDTCMYVSVGSDSAYMVNTKFVDNQLNYKSEATDEVPYVEINLLRLQEEHFSGKIVVDTEEIQIVPPLSVTYNLYTSEQDFVSQGQQDAAQYQFWKKLKLEMQVNVKNETGIAFTLDGELVHLVVTRNTLEYRSLNEQKVAEQGDVTTFSLTYNETCDKLDGYYQKKNADKSNKILRMKGEIDGKFESPLRYEDKITKLSVDELLSLSPMYIENNETKDKAQSYASEGFYNLMLYCMDSNWRKVFFSKDNAPDLDDDLKGVLNSNIPGQSETAQDFYKKYSVPYIAHVLYNAANRDDAVDNIDIKRVDAFLDKGSGYEPNYINQTNLLYKYGYKKAVTRINDYINDQNQRGNVFWAQQMLYTLKQPHIAIEMIGLLSNVTEQGQSEIQRKLNSWIFKMNLLDPSTACSKELTQYLISGMLDRMVSDYYINSLDDNMNLETVPSQSSIESFLDSLDEVATQVVTDAQTKDQIESLTRESRQNYEMAITLYHFSAVMGAAKKFITNDAVLESKFAALAEKGGLYKAIFTRIPASKMKIFCSTLGFAAGIFSSLMLGMFGDFHSLTDVQKALTIATIVAFAAPAVLTFLVKVGDKLFRYSLGFFEKVAKSMIALSAKTFTQTIGKIMTAVVSKAISLWAKVSSFLLKAIKAIAVACRFILQIISIAMSVFDLLDSIRKGDTFGIVLNSIMIGAAVGELVVMFIGLFIASTALAVIGAIFLVIGIIALLIDMFRPHESEPHKFVFSDEMSSWRNQKRSYMEMWMNFEEGEYLYSNNGTYTLSLSKQSLQVTGKLNISLTNTKADKKVYLNIDAKKVCVTDSDSNLYRVLYFTEAFGTSKLPLVLTLQDDGSLIVRTRDSDTKVQIDDTSFVQPQQK
jgi:hypothetical protein